MGTDVDAFLRRLAQELRPRAHQSAEVLLRHLRGELPGLWKEDDLSPVAREETAGHVTAFLDVLEHGLDVTEVETPASAPEVARRFARRGVPVSTLLRAYRLGHVSLLQQIQREATRLTDDWELINAAGIRLIATGFEYVDRSSEQVVVAYQEERDRLLQRRLLLTNEASRRIGTTLDTARTAQELAEVGTDDFADLVTVDLFESVLQDDGTPPPVLRRIAQHAVPDGGTQSAVATGRTHTYPADSGPAHALATGQPLLRHLTAADTPDRTGGPLAPGAHSALLLPLRARGSTLGLAQFFRHRTEAPFDEEDLLLAQEIASRAAVYIDNARRYTHERSTALTLQRSLLPRRPVAQSAVETAARYLPSGSGTGVGGDWYDVIPLSGARVALVVGDVVGRGLHAAATMGRLRTAVRAFADIDLMPDELLTHLDDVVIRLQREESSEEGETSATCLYAIYDPVSRLCSLASAGHLVPAVVTPLAVDDGRPAGRAADFPEMPIGPPLGLGGLPFETAQFELPEGSLLALFTDGLLHSRTRDVDTARSLLSDVLARAPGPPEEICDRLLAALLPSRPADDVALLVARTRALDPGHVATLNLPSDPAAVAGARDFAAGRLAAWGLDELAFTTELMVSELVTNAIRYGRGPIQLRLILQSTLTCEVSDASSTAPHLRRARAFDEGGRGLLLVAQLAEHWGTRQTRDGKIIWAEQPLPAESGVRG
ncbi:ATP-binding SpoIIE family protein phosphatase [Streptomyces sp.]|uniref:ATP-binding SpoIIE family protein phosphatase n=1 Tax=Streptomyces sp. TaxID=1931 RepID=UPI002D4612E2|nr:SpoIIE family protein phosphatase [Streptomyces sp.]HZF92592.1 SpoIIE family protein phosphatase [Streptomyces sp.]